MLTEQALSENICKIKGNKSCGQYVVFAQAPLLLFQKFDVQSPLISNISKVACKSLHMDDCAKKSNVFIREMLNEWNVELRHEHIFFCENGKIVDDLGFRIDIGNYLKANKNRILSKLNEKKIKNWESLKVIVFEVIKGVLSNYDGVIFSLRNRILYREYRTINSEKYNPKLIRESITKVLKVKHNESMCSIRENRKYNLISNNCQHFTKEVRHEYKKKANKIRSSYKVIRRSTAPKGCWCAGPKAMKIDSDTKKTNGKAGGKEGQDGITVELSQPLNRLESPGFPGFRNEMCYYGTIKTHCSDPQCGEKTGVSEYMVIEEIVKK